MFSQVFDLLGKTTESSMRVQREIMERWFRWPSASSETAEGATEDAASMQERWKEFVNTALAKQRELLDTNYRSGLQLLEQAGHLSDAKSADEWRRLAAELWRKMFDVAKAQSETQFEEMMKTSRFWLEAARQRSA